MKKIISAIIAAAMLLSLAACTGSAGTAETESTEQESASAPEESTAETSAEAAESSPEESAAEPTTNILIAYFSRADENYGVGVVEKGNTRIVAEMIAEETGGDLFEIRRVDAYPVGYDDCTAEARQEKDDSARPELTASVENFDDYDIIFLGYPIWWGDMPMPVYTFLESYDFSGKTVIPFCTHAGSGLSGTVEALAEKLSGATVLEGLAIPGTTAQNKQDEALQSVKDWLGGISLE